MQLKNLNYIFNDSCIIIKKKEGIKSQKNKNFK